MGEHRDGPVPPSPLPKLPGTPSVRELELEEECRQLRLAQRISRVGSWRMDLADRRLTASDELLALYGVDRAGFGRPDGSLVDNVHDDDRHLLIGAVARLADGGAPMNVRYRVTRVSDGLERWFDARGIAETDPTGAIAHVIGTVTDVTELVHAELESREVHTELTQAHGYQQAVIAATPDAIHIYEVAHKQLSRANRSGLPLIGYTDEEVEVMSGRSLERFVPPEDLLELQQAFVASERLPDGEVLRLRHRVRHNSGELRWMSRRMTPFARNDDHTISLVLVVSRDVTDVVAVEEQLEHAALHDELTGLPNRRLIRDRLESALQRHLHGTQPAILICDLDGFKRINDSHGHPVGDEVLVQAARRLVAATRPEDTVARMGGDEFAILLEISPEHDGVALAARVAERIATAIAEPIRSGAVEHSVSVSIGIRLAEPGVAAEALLSDADAAMYFVKAHGAGGHAFYDPAHRPDTAGLDRIERHIRRALAEDTVEVYYQPIVNPHTNAVHGVEALLRLRDDDGSFLDTARVVEVAERTGMIAALDARMLRIACAQAARWRRDPVHRALVLKLNRSVKDITQPGFYHRITDELARSGLAPHALTLEITETVLLDATAENLVDLRALNADGIGLAIDDFGTGYASLRYLAELPITCIKIDRSFTGRLPSDETSMTLVRTTIGLAEQLGIKCIVEGVETTEQLDALSGFDRLLIQGYLFARPQSATVPLSPIIAPNRMAQRQENPEDRGPGMDSPAAAPGAVRRPLTAA